jgi:hypothetical protein
MECYSELQQHLTLQESVGSTYFTSASTSACICLATLAVYLQLLVERERDKEEIISAVALPNIARYQNTRSGIADGERLAGNIRVKALCLLFTVSEIC